MGQHQRRPGFLRWGEGARADADTSPEASANADEPRVDEPAAPGAAAEAATAEAPAPAEAVVPDAASAATPVSPAAHDAPPVETPQPEVPFLRDLVGAMRGVAESSRDATLADLRSAVDQRLEELKSASGERAEELRRRSELDLGGIGDWERSELERVRAEAEERRKARRELLEKELADHQAATDRDLEALRARLADYEREMDAFFAQLTEIEDPTAFVAAAKRMPPPPDLAMTAGKAGPSETAKVTDVETGKNGASQPVAGVGSLAQRLAQLDERLGTTTAAAAEPAAGPQPAAEPAAEHTTEAATEPAAAAATDAAEAPATATVAGSSAAASTATVAAPAAAPVAAEASTPIVVKGLGSFGAITSFKQALERVEGIRGVTLSLGPTGDFVYRASHAADFDLIAAIRSIEGPNAGIEETDGQVRVTIERPR